MSHRLRRKAFLLLSLSGLIAGLTTAVFVRGQPADGARLLAGRAFGSTPLLEDLRELCDRIGGRPTGSASCDRAVEWAAARFRAANVDQVSIESFTVPAAWLADRAEAQCISPVEFSIRIAAAPGSASTPGGGPIEARLVDAGDGSAEALTKLGESARGAIALVKTRETKTLDDLFDEYVRNAPLLDAARKAGISAVLLQSTRPRGLLYRHPVEVNGVNEPVPAAIISREHAARLARLLEKGEVRVRLTLANKTGGSFESRNVVAEIRGREKPEEIVQGQRGHRLGLGMGLGREPKPPRKASNARGSREAAQGHKARRTDEVLRPVGRLGGRATRRQPLVVPASATLWDCPVHTARISIVFA